MMEGFLLILPAKYRQLHLLEHLPLSLCTYPFFFIIVCLILWISPRFFHKTGFGSGLPIFINSRVSLNLKVITS